MRKYVFENKEESTFKVNRKVFTDHEILENEREEIFSKCWLFIGHESEIPNKGDFKRKKIGGRELLFNRGNDGKIRAFYNSCPHRGAMVCREHRGNSKVFRCFYHAWSFDNTGKLVGFPDKEGFPDNFNSDHSKDLMEVYRVESYRGFVFVNFDNFAILLEEYLGKAKEYIDLVADQSEAGMEILASPQEYSMRANWKLLVENSIDGYHGIPTHKTYFDIVATRGGELSNGDYEGYGVDLGNGHAAIEYTSAWGRPVARWMPAWGEDGKREIEKIKKSLTERFGSERADRIANYNRNIFIFPNLIINDIMAVTVRTFYPISPDYMEVTGYALATKNENEQFRQRRNDNFLEFLGPGGFATPDDNEALELCQQGFENNKEAQWNDISKGMNRNPKSTDEEQIRAFWRRYSDLMSKQEAKI